MKRTEAQIREFLTPFDDGIADQARQLRDYLREETRPGTEIVGDSTLSLNIGYGFTEKAWDCYCAIIVYSKHINISFPAGAFLTDPHRLLKGTGKRIRHIRLAEFKDVKAPAVRRILAQARQRAWNMLGDEFRTGKCKRSEGM